MLVLLFLKYVSDKYAHIPYAPAKKSDASFVTSWGEWLTLKMMTLTLKLPDSKEAVLRAKAQAQGLSAEQYVQQVLERDLGESVHGPISALFREIWGDLPDEARPPKDGLDQIDHYVYGAPKREQ